MRRLFRLARFAGAAALAAFGLRVARDANCSLRSTIAKVDDVLDRVDAIVKDVGAVVKTVADGVTGAHVKDLLGKLEQHTDRITAAVDAVASLRERAAEAKSEVVKKRVFGLVRQ